ncbi:hypothetical protein [Methanoregula sp.]|uniref:hypothetical protein n=1 Tax=Methanoregula sp. TaxID=2052170 RepID=UPI0035670FAE
MKVLWIALLLCTCVILGVAFGVFGGIHITDRYPVAPVVGNLPEYHPVNLTAAFPVGDGTGPEEKNALFSKYVALGTPFIIVSLYSGDPADPLSVTIITPDKSLGPFYDASDGMIDGRIDLKITDPETLIPGLWKFQVHSRKEISYGNLENLSWIRANTLNHKTDE